MTKVKFTRNGHETELKDEIAKRYEKTGRVEIVKGKPGRPPKPKEGEGNAES